MVSLSTQSTQCTHGSKYFRVPARRGLQWTARAATRHGARDPLVRPQVDNYLARDNYVKIKKKEERTEHWTCFSKTGWTGHVTICILVVEPWAYLLQVLNLWKILQFWFFFYSTPHSGIVLRGWPLIILLGVGGADFCRWIFFWQLFESIFYFCGDPFFFRFAPCPPDD